MQTWQENRKKAIFYFSKYSVSLSQSSVGNWENNVICHLSGLVKFIDWPDSIILISFYKTHFFLIYTTPLWIFKKFQNLILESSRHNNSAANFRSLGYAQKTLLRLKNAPKLLHPFCLVNFKLTMTTLRCHNFWTSPQFVLKFWG